MTMTTDSVKRGISDSPSMRRFRKASNQSIGSQANANFLPNLDDLKYNSSFLIGQNSNKKVKAFDFMGYAKRKEIYDGAPKLTDSRFEPTEVCPLVSTKHK